MTRRMIQMLIAVAVFVAALGFVKFKQIQTAIAQGKSFRPPPEAVTTIVAQAEDWPSTIEAVGSVEPVQGVTLSADQPGIVDRIAFESGSRVRAGDVLVSLDTRQERAQLAAAEAQRDLAKTNLSRSQRLLDTQVIAQAVAFDLPVVEVPITTRYHADASSTSMSANLKYGLGTLWTMARFTLHRHGMLRSRLFVP